MANRYRDKLYDLLKGIGLEVKGADPLVTLSTMLWRMRDKIIHFQGKGYWPQHKPYPPTGYVPFDTSAAENDIEDLVNEHFEKGGEG